MANGGGPAISFGLQFVELGLPDFDQGKLGRHKKAVQQDKQENGKNLEAKNARINVHGWDPRR